MAHNHCLPRPPFPSSHGFNDHGSLPFKPQPSFSLKKPGLRISTKKSASAGGRLLNNKPPRITQLTNRLSDHSPHAQQSSTAASQMKEALEQDQEIVHPRGGSDGPREKKGAVLKQRTQICAPRGVDPAQNNQPNANHGHSMRDAFEQAQEAIGHPKCRSDDTTKKNGSNLKQQTQLRTPRSGDRAPTNHPHAEHGNFRFALPETNFEQAPSVGQRVKLSGKSTSGSWLDAVRPREPLSREEEHQFSEDVKDLLYLESKKKELKENLGHNPTDLEWANHIGCSIYRLYARLGKGRASRRKMIAANFPLVASLAKRFRGRGLSYHELCQEGVMGLLKSSERYSTIYNTKFSTYSYFWICERMSAAAKKFQHIMNIGESVYRTLSFLHESEAEFRESHGRNPTINELSFASKIDKDKIRQVLSTVRPAKYLEASPSSNYQYSGRNTWSRELQDPEDYFHPWLSLWESELKTEFTRVFQALTPRELQVIRIRFGLDGEIPRTRVEVAVRLRLNYETVRVAEKSAMKKLKRSAEDYGLQHYLSKI